MNFKKEKEEWLLLFIQKFREVLDSKEYHDYREFFPAFCNNRFLSIELLELHDKKGVHEGNIISFYASKYGDHVKIVKKQDSPWEAFFEGVSDILQYLNDFLSKAEDLSDIQAFRRYYEYNQSFLPNFSLKEFKNSIELPLNFLEKNITTFIKVLIEKEILKKLILLTNNHLYQKAINRISLLKIEEIREILQFLESDWSEIKKHF